MIERSRSLVGALLLGLAMASLGCARSARIAYARHLSTTVAPGRAANDDLATAFELDDFASRDATVSRKPRDGD